MTQKEYEILRSNRKKILDYRDEITYACADTVGAQVISGMPSGGGGSNSTEKLMIKKEEFEQAITVLQTESARICFQIEKPKMKKLFILFYVNCLEMKEIAQELGYSSEKAAYNYRLNYLKQNHVKA